MDKRSYFLKKFKNLNLENGHTAWIFRIGKYSMPVIKSRLTGCN